ncbi:hypothetical protein MRX96_026626 [Rhipicephalus microplus]
MNRVDETGFQNYFTPPPVGQNYYMPNYYFYPQAYPQPPPVYTLPPLPPAPIYAPASLEELEAFPVNAPPNSIDSRRPDESGFADYLSPPPPVSPYGLSYYRPLPPTRGYYGPPPMQTYPAPMHGYYAPSYYPPPPSSGDAPSSPDSTLQSSFLGALPCGPWEGDDFKVFAPHPVHVTWGASPGDHLIMRNQPFANFMVYGAVVLGFLVIFTAIVMFAYALAAMESIPTALEAWYTGTSAVNFDFHRVTPENSAAASLYGYGGFDTKQCCKIATEMATQNGRKARGVYE